MLAAGMAADSQTPGISSFTQQAVVDMQSDHNNVTKAFSAPLYSLLQAVPGMPTCLESLTGVLTAPLTYHL